MCHTLNLCLKTAVEKCKTLTAALTKVGNIVRSAKKSCKLAEFFEKSGVTLFSRCLPRWNTNFAMVKRAVQFPWTEHGQEFKPKDRITKAELDVLMDFVEIMGSFEAVFRTLQSAEMPSAARVIPSVRLL